MIKALDVWVGEQRVGRLQMEASRLAFAYFPGIGPEQAVSLTMPPRLEAWMSAELHPIFQMNLPEGHLREALQQALAKLFGSDDMALLSVLGRHQMGRLAFSLPDALPADEAGAREDLQALLHAEGRQAFTGLLERHLLHSGISGVQPKVLLEVKDKAAAKTPYFIVKSWGPDYPQLAANEFFCLKAAKRAGLKVPGFHLSQSRELLFIERFDREPGGAYIGFEDLAVLQGLASRKKYDSSLERAAKTLLAFVSPECREEAMRDFFTLCCLNWLIRNGDAHLKNFGLLYDSPQGPRRLAPAFDLVCTQAYLPKDVPALSLAGSKKWWAKAALLSFGELSCRLKAAEAKACLHAAAEGVAATLGDLRQETEQAPAFVELVSKMQSLWEAALAEA